MNSAFENECWINFILTMKILSNLHNTKPYQDLPLSCFFYRTHSEQMKFCWKILFAYLTVLLLVFFKGFHQVCGSLTAPRFCAQIQNDSFFQSFRVFWVFPDKTDYWSAIYLYSLKPDSIYPFLFIFLLSFIRISTNFEMFVKDIFQWFISLTLN